MSPISTQPTTSIMDVYGPFTTDEKRSPCQHDDHTNFPCEGPSSSHRACHKARLRRIILPIALSLLSVGALLVVSYCSEVGDLLGVLGLGNGHGLSLDKRQTTTSSSSSFTSNKCGIPLFSSFVLFWQHHFSVPDYSFCRPFPRPHRGYNAQFLVLQRFDPTLPWKLNYWTLLVLIGSFENPLCCPCYLCACCGGLGKQDYTVSVTILTRVVSMFGVHRLWPLRSRPWRSPVVEFLL